MSQQVQELIDKIKAEGVQAADQKAKEIETNAQSEAGKIVTDAEAKAKQIISEAMSEAEKIHSSTQMALKQAARDTLLALRKEIEAVLTKVVAKQINASLSTDNLADILGEVIKKSVETESADQEILVGLNQKDVDALKNGFLSKLQNEVKSPIKFQSNDDIARGFTISYDKGKSCFDFTDKGLAEYLSGYLNTQVAGLLKEAE